MEQVKDLLGNLKEMQPTNIKICEIHKCELPSIGQPPLVIYMGCKECENELRIKSLLKMVKDGEFADIPLRFKKSSIADFNNKYTYIEGSYFITGTCGTGKTHLAIAMLKEFCIKNKTLRDSKFLNFQDIAISVKCSFADNNVRMDTIIDRCNKLDFAIFDDICTTKPTATEIDSLYLIVNHRYEFCKPTIYTSNLSIGEISTIYGDRIASRLSACTQIKLNGNDRRLQK